MSSISLPHLLPKVFRAESAGNSNCVIQLNLSQPVYIRIKDGTCSVIDGTAEAADLTLTMNDDYLEPLLRGKVNGMAGVMTGKLRFKGDMGLAQRISKLFDLDKL